MSDKHAFKPLRLAASLAILFHVLGLFFALFGIRPGTPIFPLDARMAYIASSVWGWQMAWGVWMAAAATFVLLIAAVQHAWNAHGACARLAVMVGVLAAGLDLLNDSILITVLPELASRGREAEQVFLGFERFTSAAGIIIANGFYSVSVLLMTCALRGRISPFAYGMGWATLIAGLLLSAVGFFHDPRLPEIFTGPAIGTYLFWVLGMAWQEPKDRQNQ